MLKGVNRKIIEVMDTQNEYFERAILFVKESKLGEDEAQIKGHADRFLEESREKRLRRILYGSPWWNGVKLFLAAGAGYLLSYFVPLF